MSPLPLRLTRADRRITEVLLLLIAAASLAVVIWSLWPTDLVSFTHPALDNGPATRPAGLPGNVQVFWAPETLWTIDHPGYGQVVLVGLHSALSALSVGVGALLVLSLVRAITREQAFTPEALARLRQLALLLLAAGLLLPFVRMVCQMTLVAGLVDMPGVLFTGSVVEFTPVLVGILLLFLAEAFQRGARLEQDVEGLV